MTYQHRSHPASILNNLHGPVPSDGRKAAGLFPMRRCGDCGWRFHTPEGLRWHRDVVHVAQRGPPADHGVRRADPFELTTAADVEDLAGGRRVLAVA